MASLRFQIGGVEEEFARVEIVGSHGDGWLQSRVTLRVGGFQGDFPSDLDCWGFARFVSELRELYKALKGTATFSTYEKQLELALVGDGLGHVRVKGEAMDYAGTGNKLTFRLDIDQTQIPQLLRELNAIVTAYPAPA